MTPPRAQQGDEPLAFIERRGCNRYTLSNAEGVFAVARRSAIEQKTPEVRYVFTDHLGSTDVITDETGSVEHERQSYDAFGARRNAAWGKPMPPPSGPPETTAMGYTGHALDAEVGLVNAKGRLYDPKVGRFLQVDPLETDLFNSQRWNSYTRSRYCTEEGRVTRRGGVRSASSSDAE